MPFYKSKLFRRNNGGMVRKPYPKRSPRVYNRAAPRPATSRKSMVNTQELKQITGISATIACRDTGQCFHLDQVTQGTGVTARLGQKHRVTGVHIRGQWSLPIAAGHDQVGYYLVWDRQPNEILANPADIISLGTDSIRAFPNPDNLARFVILARKTHTAVNAVSTTTGTWNTQWNPDDYWDFTDKKLVATQVMSGDGLIGDRTSGALILIGLGQNPSADSANLQFDYRLYFEDV